MNISRFIESLGPDSEVALRHDSERGVYHLRVVMHNRKLAWLLDDMIVRVSKLNDPIGDEFDRLIARMKASE